MRDGNVIRLNALTGREQRRFMAEWRTPEQKNAGTPRIPDMWDAKLSGDGHTLVTSHREWVYVWDVESGALRRKIRHSHRAAGGWRWHLTVARWRPRPSGSATNTARIAATTRSACTTSRLESKSSHSSPATAGPA